ncbi:UDP-2,3-diacylglucosamine diphosphatase LpxI, partial [Mesorhizobium sp.]|uniref:UDP-2,3-diacylglucosamine diphosphatase LpxI domain-containing protein n=1 Tax=Mesorhizobium sp. TaxID=1871066 RepID=UPI000FE5BFC0
PELTADEGTLTATGPNKSDWRDIEAARKAAKAIGALDIGQAAIAIGGRAVALEGIEGTAGLLDRMRDLRG